MKGFSREAQQSFICRPDGRGVSLSSCIETVVPGPACAEMFSDAPESAMFPAEAAAVAGAVAERRREFGTVRYCARRALRRLGLPAVPILPDRDRAPRWPAGVVGSMTHCAGYRAAAVARSGELRALGIDAEPHAQLPDEAPGLVLTEEERARVLALTGAHRDVHWDRIVFCAKEAVYKAWFPLTRRRLDFADVSTTVRPDGTFGARVEQRDFSGRWTVSRGLVLAATSVARDAPGP
jgi:4'-phosphopantetheinyl transferase EntD